MNLRRSGSAGQHTPDRIAALKAGDVMVFEELYLEKFAGWCRYASTIVSTEDATDVVQDVLWNVWSRRESLPVNSEDDFATYVLRGIRNRSLNLIRQDRAREAREAKEALEDSLTTSERVAEHAVGNEGDGINPEQDLLDQVYNTIDALPARSREVLLHRWAHGMKFDQIASLMEISVASAHVLHSRALALVRKKLNLK